MAIDYKRHRETKDKGHTLNLVMFGTMDGGVSVVSFQPSVWLETNSAS